VSRRELALRVAGLVGEEQLTLDDPADGWPALGRVFGPDGPIGIALYVAPVGLSHRGRDDVERRFQNPGRDRPIRSIEGKALVYLGVWEADPHGEPAPVVLVTADAYLRVGRRTRASVFPRLDSLLIARKAGIDIAKTTTGEEIVAFVPELLPALVHAQTIAVSPNEVRFRQEVLAEVGESSPERRRRISTTLVRANSFARSVP